MSLDEGDLGEVEAVSDQEVRDDEAILRVDWSNGQSDRFGITDMALLEGGVLQARLHDGSLVTLSPSLEWGIKDPNGEVTGP